MSTLLAPRIVRLADVPAQPWKNGGGTTRELLAWPSPADWRVRLSIATIDRDGDFSAYPGVRRWFAVIDGAGIELDLDGGTRRLTPADAPLEFDGAAAPGCRLIDGPTRDLNLMLRGGATGFVTRAVAGAPWRPNAVRCGCYAVRRGTCVADGTAHAVEPGMLLWFDAAPESIVFTVEDTAATGACWIAAS